MTQELKLPKELLIVTCNINFCPCRYHPLGVFTSLDDIIADLKSKPYTHHFRVITGNNPTDDLLRKRVTMQFQIDAFEPNKMYGNETKDDNSSNGDHLGDLRANIDKLHMG